nr:immunoglobulin heavy chain junction region [Macaca mulatta]MOW75580.1 immunoglobulin heavy chain junction region [Macaca mulatta]MOW75701.1 immunoglobulin heavy chain junction region [Macaca mulatta]MOW76968.1 immunoglobulin heavy chain junction region [Macaca mulatta]MOW77315.1 immunoglobulin heavy chain junction region [Macaca mulatta]
CAKDVAGEYIFWSGRSSFAHW